MPGVQECSASQDGGCFWALLALEVFGIEEIYLHPKFEGLIWVVVKIKVPFWVTLNNRCRIITGTQKGTIIFTTTHIIRKS